MAKGGAGSRPPGASRGGRSAGGARRAPPVELAAAWPPVTSSRVRPSWSDDSSDRPDRGIKSALVIRTIIEEEPDLDGPHDEPDDELGERPSGISIGGFILSARVVPLMGLGVGLLAA